MNDFEQDQWEMTKVGNVQAVEYFKAAMVCNKLYLRDKNEKKYQDT